MDRVEAYQLLTEEMQKLARKAARQESKAENTKIETDLFGSGGAQYRVGLTVERLGPNRIVISGSIHDNTTHSFKLLEERLEVEV
ncbi:MAG: hypothetical protein AAF495_18720 [Pseudomonadota bacterium]